MFRGLGAHSVANRHMYSVTRVRGLSAIALAILMGLWILRHQHVLLRTPAWEPLYSLIDGRVWILGWMILVGGLLGVLGLAARSRVITTTSSVVCLLWFGWTGAFLWYSNFTDAPNIGAVLCLYGWFEYFYRLVLLARKPKPGEARTGGW